MKNLWLCIPFALLANCLFAQAVLTLETDTNQISIGEQLRVKIEIEAPENATISWPNFEKDIEENIEVVSEAPVDTIRTEAKTIFRKEVLLTSFDSGYYPVPPLTFLVNTDSLFSEAFLITVNTIAVDTNKAILDIKPPIAVDFSILEWMRNNIDILLYVAIPLLLLIAFLAYWFNRPKTTIVVPTMPPPPPAHTLALDKLKLLREAQIWQSGQYKEYHSQLTDIFREYLENRYQIPALEQTTEEIILGLRSISLQPGLRDEIRQILSLADLVKFAKETPLASENELAMEQIERFVRTTAVKSQAPQPNQP